MTAQGAIYLAGMLLSWRFIAGAWYRVEREVFPAVFMGAVGAIIWPLVLIGALIYAACRRWPDAMFRLFIHEPSRERLERRRQRRQAEIDQLERELAL